MKFFVKTTPAPPVKSKNITPISLFLAAVLAVMAVTQLLNYTGFVSLFVDYGLPFDLVGTGILTAGIIFLELLALPFLLRLRLSPAMRVVSMVAGWLTVGIWLLVQIWVNHPFLYEIGVTPVRNVGLLGASVPLMRGWWSVLFVAALGVLMAWSAWGMWPGKRRP